MAKRPVLTIGIIAVLCLVVGLAIKSFFFAAPAPKQAEEEGGDKTRQELIDEAEVVAHDVELVQGRQGAMAWKLLAKTAKYNQEEKLVGVTEPRLTAYYGEDRREVFIKADRGEVDQGEDNLTLHDNVTARFGKMDVTAPYLDYVGGENKVFIKGGVHLIKPELDLTAEEAVIDLEKRELVATGGVKAILNTSALKEPLKQ